MKRIFYLYFFLAFTLVTSTIKAQTDSTETVDYSSPEEYEIGGIEVVGARFTDKKALINISGLKVGQTIRLPGDAISDAIKKLWNQRLFVDVEIRQTKKIGEIVFLEIRIEERPRLSRHAFMGVPKSFHDDLNGETARYLLKGSIVTQSMKVNTIREIKNFFKEKGFLNTEVTVLEEEDDVLINSVKLIFDINRQKRVHIDDVVFSGIENVKKGKLRRLMKKTKRMRWYTFFLPSKLIEHEYKNDKQAIIDYYNTIGYRDAVITKDTTYLVPFKNKQRVKVELEISEGKKYYFGDIAFKGNSVYSTELLEKTLGITKGDVYNEQLLQTRLQFDQAGRDVSTLYMDNGYLFFRVNPVEVGIDGDSINLDIRITEGPVAIIRNVLISGNDRTNEHVIRRELRTKPGQAFSRTDIIRSQREILALNYFNPESLQINTPVDAENGTVDIEYVVEERPSDQLELSAGWGGVGTGVIGTLGVTFNNFSLRNITKPEAWSPLPVGDGQRLSLRIQTNGKFFQSYNASFTEPWLGGKKPNSFTVAWFYNRITNGLTAESSDFRLLGILGGSVGLGTRLRWPDDFFISTTALTFQNYNMRFNQETSPSGWNFIYLRNDGSTAFLPPGQYNNFALKQTIARNSVDTDIFPTRGARITLTVQLSPPYSLFRQKNIADLGPEERFKWLEYHKWNFKAEWYTQLVSKLVLKTSVKMGFLGTYNKEIGTSPFERFQLGGDGLSNQNTYQGREIISLRGYTLAETSNTGAGGAAIFNKMTVELRYLISPNPSATIYALTFLEAGGAWNSFDDYNPFEMKRAAGLGFRVFLPMFGTLGVDYGLGFDKTPTNARLDGYGRFNIVLGFEPE